MTITLNDWFNWHDYLTKKADLSPKMKEVLEKVEEQIHLDVMSVKRMKYE